MCEKRQVEPNLHDPTKFIRNTIQFMQRYYLAVLTRHDKELVVAVAAVLEVKMAVVAVQIGRIGGDGAVESLEPQNYAAAALRSWGVALVQQNLFHSLGVFGEKICMQILYCTYFEQKKYKEVSHRGLVRNLRMR